jgi:hypothetical protein
MSSDNHIFAFREACKQSKAGDRTSHWVLETPHLEIGIHQGRVMVRTYGANELIVCAWAAACQLRAKEGTFTHTSGGPNGMSCFAFEPK